MESSLLSCVIICSILLIFPISYEILWRMRLMMLMNCHRAMIAFSLAHFFCGNLPNYLMINSYKLLWMWRLAIVWPQLTMAQVRGLTLLPIDVSWSNMVNLSVTCQVLFAQQSVDDTSCQIDFISTQGNVYFTFEWGLFLHLFFHFSFCLYSIQATVFFCLTAIVNGVFIFKPVFTHQSITVSSLSLSLPFSVHGFFCSQI